jgi:bifunctional DNA-binding transcriptional regulator/antitoxin component of YhaV-PrlF toxin-antitoxin module
MTTAVTGRGQTVVPARIRRSYHLGPASRLEWIDDGQCIRVIPLPADPVAAAQGMFAGSGLTAALLKSRREDRAGE